MTTEITPAKVRLSDQLGPADEAHHLPTPEDLRSYADDADQHGNHLVQIAPASLRGIAGELNRLRYALDLVRSHPEFDEGGPMADMMDQVLSGARAPMLDALGAIEAALDAAIAAERERCAKVCEAEHVGSSLEATDLVPEDFAYNMALGHAAAAIRVA